MHNSLYLLMPYPCILPLPFSRPIGNHLFVLYICESVSYVLIFKLFLSWWNTHNIKFTILTILSVQLRGIMC